MTSQQGQLQDSTLEVEVVLDHPVEDQVEEFIFLWIQSLAASGGLASPNFREGLGPSPTPTIEDDPTFEEHPIFEVDLQDSPASPDSELIIDDPLAVEDQEMPTDEEAADVEMDSPRSPSPEPLQFNEELGYYLTFYQFSFLASNYIREP